MTKISTHITHLIVCSMRDQAFVDKVDSLAQEELHLFIGGMWK